MSGFASNGSETGGRRADWTDSWQQVCSRCFEGAFHGQSRLQSYQHAKDVLGSRLGRPGRRACREMRLWTRNAGHARRNTRRTKLGDRNMATRDLGRISSRQTRRKLEHRAKVFQQWYGNMWRNGIMRPLQSSGLGKYFQAWMRAQVLPQRQGRIRYDCLQLSTTRKPSWAGICKGWTMFGLQSPWWNCLCGKSVCWLRQWSRRSWKFSLQRMWQYSMQG